MKKVAERGVTRGLGDIRLGRTKQRYRFIRSEANYPIADDNKDVRLGQDQRVMDAEDFRRIALQLAGAEEGSHMGSPDFRVGGRIFATLASQERGYGNLMLTPEQQRAFVEEAPEIFIPIAGGWGQMGKTHIKLAAASEEVLAGALHTAWKLRCEKNARGTRKNLFRGKSARAKRAGIKD